MLDLPIVDPIRDRLPFPTHSPSLLRTLFERVYTVFLAIIMLVQYAVVWLSVHCRHWKWLPSAIDSNNLKVPSRNIANLKGLLTCLKTLFYPIPQEELSQVGRKEGLRVVHDLIYRPASGLCLATALTFLSQVLPVEKTTDEFFFLCAAQGLKRDHDETIVKIQSTYDALIGADLKVPQQELSRYRQRTSKESQDPLMESLEAFLSQQDPPQSLRQSVFDDLENKGIAITPRLYALVLELDSFWRHDAQPDENKYLSVHGAIIQTVAQLVHLEMGQAESYDETISDACQHLASCDDGGYLIQFRDHSLALVKTPEWIVLFDPSEGLGLIPMARQRDVFTHLLDYYCDNDFASFKLIPIAAIDPKYS